MTPNEEIRKLAEETKEFCFETYEKLRCCRNEAFRCQNKALARRHEEEIATLQKLHAAMVCISLEAKERNISKCCPLLLDY